MVRKLNYFFFLFFLVDMLFFLALGLTLSFRCALILITPCSSVPSVDGICYDYGRYQTALGLSASDGLYSSVSPYVYPVCHDPCHARCSPVSHASVRTYPCVVLWCSLTDLTSLVLWSFSSRLLCLLLVIPTTLALSSGLGGSSRLS